MAQQSSDELAAEIESFWAELRLRAERHERAARTPNPLDLPALNSADLDLPQIRALIAQRYEQSRLERRLSDVERRLAEIEARNGRA
jgi:hypothetical protein